MTYPVGSFASRPSLVLCGDSLLEQSTGPGGLACLLAQMYSRKADVIVRGYSGYNTGHFLDLLHRHKSSGAWGFRGMFVLWLGANDAAKPAPVKPEQHVPLDQYVDNLNTIVDMLSHGSNPVILMTPPPVDDVAYNRHCQSIGKPTLRFLEVTRSYAEAVLQLGRRKNIPVVDLFNTMLESEEWRDYLSDGLHLTESGYRMVSQLLMAAIKDGYKHWTPENLLLDAPIWQQAHCWETANTNF